MRWDATAGIGGRRRRGEAGARIDEARFIFGAPASLRPYDIADTHDADAHDVAGTHDAGARDIVPSNSTITA